MPGEWDDVLSALGLDVPGVGYVPTTAGPTNVPAQMMLGAAENAKNLFLGPGRALSGEMPVSEQYEWGPGMALSMLGGGLGAAEDASLGSLALRARKLTPFEGTSESALDNLYGTGVQNPRSFDIVNEDSKPVGRVWTSQYRPDQVLINYISGMDAKGVPTWAPNSLGTADLRSLLQSFRDQFPEVQKIGGYRISGARDAAGKTGPAYAKLPVSSQ